jgi:hypothetical protein
MHILLRKNLFLFETNAKYNLKPEKFCYFFHLTRKSTTNKINRTEVEVEVERESRARFSFLFEYFLGNKK